MGYVLVALAFIAAATSAYGTYSTGQAQKNAAKYNAEVNKNNAEIAAQQAAHDAQAIRDKNKKVLAAQRAAYSASGIDNSGTPRDVAADSAAQGEMDALTAIYTGKLNSNASLARAQINRMEGKSASTAGTIGAAGSLLGGVSQAGYYASKNPSM